jgi:hypothetical protein
MRISLFLMDSKRYLIVTSFLDQQLWNWPFKRERKSLEEGYMLICYIFLTMEKNNNFSFIDGRKCCELAGEGLRLCWKGSKA